MTPPYYVCQKAFKFPAPEGTIVDLSNYLGLIILLVYCTALFCCHTENDKQQTFSPGEEEMRTVARTICLIISTVKVVHCRVESINEVIKLLGLKLLTFIKNVWIMGGWSASLHTTRTIAFHRLCNQLSKPLKKVRRKNWGFPVLSRR